MEKPTIPKGTRDFGPAQMAKRQFILENIKRVFQKYGFQPLETPAMENLSTLTGKYGEEGDQLLFRILDSGEYFEKFKKEHDSKSESTIINVKDFLFDELLKFTNSFLNSNQISTEIEDPKVIVNSLRNYFYSVDFNSTVNIYRPEASELIGTFVRENLIGIAHSLSFLYHQTKLSSYDSKENKIDIEYLFKLQRDDFNEWVIPILKNIALSLVTTQVLRSNISEKGLRYDLTVPFARYVVMNRGEIAFPFKRYQMQPVWRADRPQRGRYREFYQCDADVVGTNSLICEAEIILMIKEVFKALGIKDYLIKINHREILNGIAEYFGLSGKESDLFVAIDKLEKLGKEKVKQELLLKGINEETALSLLEIFDPERPSQEIRSDLNYFSIFTDKIDKGRSEVLTVLDLLGGYQDDFANMGWDTSLARGLSYYTGCIFEVKINNVSIGSVGGGGRYDNLTSMFGDKEKLSGVGFSFGVDRLYDAMEEIQSKEDRNLFPEDALIASRVLICHTNKEYMMRGLSILRKLRNANIASEIYPDEAKAKKPLEKPLQYALKKSIPNAIVIDSDDSFVIFKNIKTGDQQKLSIEEIISRLVNERNK